MQTGHQGDIKQLLRADKIYVTVRATGTPALSASVRSGLPNNQDSAHTSTNTVLAAATGNSGADIETVLVALNQDRDPTISVKLVDAGGTVGHLEIVSVTVEGTIEGQGFSS